MTPSHWALYKSETTETHFIEHEYGFISYSLLPDALFLEDIWIAPEHRKSGLGAALVAQAEEVGREAGKQTSLALIHLSSKTSTESLKAHLTVGFLPFLAEDGKIWLRRAIAPKGE